MINDVLTSDLSQNNYDMIVSLINELNESGIKMPKFYHSFKNNGKLVSDNQVYGYSTPFDRFKLSKFQKDKHMIRPFDR